MDLGGYFNQLVENTNTPLFIALRQKVKWLSWEDFSYKAVVDGYAAIAHTSITIRMKVKVHFSDQFGQPEVHFTNYPVTLERVAWPIYKGAPFKPKSVSPKFILFYIFPFHYRFDEMITRIKQGGIIDKIYQVGCHSNGI